MVSQRSKRCALLAVGLIALLALVGVAVAAGPKVIARDTRKFDHALHAKVSAAAGKGAGCAACHKLDANGEPQAGREHVRCAQCHTYPRACDVMKRSGPKGQARICGACHVPSTSRCLPADLPPQPKTDSYEARFTHGKHASLGASIDKNCAQCHTAQAAGAAPKVGAHKSCSGCHNANGAKPVMSDCVGCHQAPRGRTAPGADPFRLASFDHRAHHAASKQASCLGCHDKLLGAGEGALPRPSMLGCQTRCHDGQKAFSAVGTKCTSCHKGKEATVPVRADVGFSHAAHAGRNVQIQNCAQCHAVEADGKLTPPLAKKDHMPCAASGCHQPEFASRTAKICGVCHDAVSASQRAVSRRREPVKAEWFERIDHAAHMAKLGTGNQACASCHGDKFGGAQRPGGHDGCAPCHGRGQAAPAMSQCAACHAQTPPAGRAGPSEWSVRATFDHKTHAADPRARGAQTKCSECHPGVAKARDLASIRTPKMADCDGCHNGKITFKTTGFDCARCHKRAGEAAKVSVGEAASEVFRGGPVTR